MRRKKLALEESVGTLLAHDLTRVVPGEFKGVQFRQGHRIREEDLELLRSMGKEHVWVLELDPDEWHENDAARRAAEAVAGKGIALGEAREGRVNLAARQAGLFVVDVEGVHAWNAHGDVMVVTKANEVRVRAGERVAAVKVIPLAVREADLAERLAQGPLLDVLPFQPKRVRMVTTGREVYTGRIQDAFRPKVAPKVEALGGLFLGQEIVPDEVEAVAGAIGRALEDADVVLVTGGMSVDPDDVTPRAIAESGVAVEVQGTPVLPGAMFLLGYRGPKVVLGLPASVIHEALTIFDLIFPKVMAGLRPSRADILRMGVGGLLEPCPTCGTSPLSL